MGGKRRRKAAKEGSILDLDDLVWKQIIVKAI